MSENSSIASHHLSDEKKQRPENMITICDKYEDKVAMLPKEKAGWITEYLYLYQGFWFWSRYFDSVESVMALHDTFKSKPTDIYLTTIPKSGTTWLKALAFALINRNRYKNDHLSDHPLLATNPHECVPGIVSDVYKNTPTYPDSHSPRLFSTHIPYSLLPQSVRDDSECRLVYLARNPKDVLVSYFHFANKLKAEGVANFDGPLTIEVAFELFCRGVSPFGPYWDHVIEYYNASLQQPEKIMFLTYEELKADSVHATKRIAKFLGCPFMEEEGEGEVKEIVKLCSFEVLSEVSKHGKFNGAMSKNLFFRKGKVGDWTNHLTDEMSQTLDELTKEKFHSLNISF